MRLIDADALPFEPYGEDVISWYATGWNDAINVINRAPTVDAEPVRLGFCKWGLGFPYCSECKMMAHENGFVGYHTSDYCPNCGAKMDGGKQDEVV